MKEDTYEIPTDPGVVGDIIIHYISGWWFGTWLL
jgi:hypothetical protein